ncbi:MAG: hydrogenase expression/formation protein HypE [Sedimentibacter sp.]|uniref:hydrogenase expression/formation protein HypE n=1 Tax=Sedimentibacter sp. TaxID=1960295 RepID=UPI0031596883
MKNTVTLLHGDGGSYTDSLIKEVFYRNFDNELLISSMDAAVFKADKCNLAFTTDSFVVKPLVFRGGDIGKLAVCGTVNDLAAAGAKPLYLSCAVIIEEGFDIDLLTHIAQSMGDVCKKTGVSIITGDTKVVEKGSADGLYINTSGIGEVQQGYRPKQTAEEDRIIITGGIAEHGTTIAVERYGIHFDGKFQSDCMPLNGIVDKLKKHFESIKIMKDPTRGGLATALNELAEFAKMGIVIDEEAVPIKQEIKSVNELLGMDPLYLACEGRMIVVVEEKKCMEVLEDIRRIEGCENAAVIGSFSGSVMKNMVLMKTFIGGKRIIGPLEGTMLPRIC